MRFDARLFGDPPDDHPDHECCGGDAELEALAASLRNESKYISHCFPPQVESAVPTRSSLAGPLSTILALAAVGLVLLGWWAAAFVQSSQRVATLPNTNGM